MIILWYTLYPQIQSLSFSPYDSSYCLLSAPWLDLTPGPSGLFLPLEEVKELLATLEGLPGENWLPMEMRREKAGEQPEETTLEQEEEKSTPEARTEPVALSTGTPGQLEEEATLQLAIHRSLESQDQEVEQQEASALRRAMALSLLEAEEPLGEGSGGRAQLVVHTSFEQDMDELDRALSAALEVHLREETVSLQGCVLPSELGTRLERRHDVSVTLHGDRVILRGFGVQPARAAHHLTALLVGPYDQNSTFPLEASNKCESVPWTRGGWDGLASGLVLEI